MPAKLNIAAGTNSAAVSDTIADAEALLGKFSGKLPYLVAASSAAGQKMVKAAKLLEQYNNGLLTPLCSN